MNFFKHAFNFKDVSGAIFGSGTTSSIPSLLVVFEDHVPNCGYTPCTHDFFYIIYIGSLLMIVQL